MPALPVSDSKSFGCYSLYNFVPCHLLTLLLARQLCGVILTYFTLSSQEIVNFLGRLGNALVFNMIMLYQLMFINTTHVSVLEALA